MHKKFWKTLLLTLPLLLLILISFWANNTVNSFQESVYRNVLKEKILNTQIFAEGFDLLIESGYDWEGLRGPYSKRIMGYVENQDSLHGVNAILLDTDYKVVSKRAKKAPEHGFCDPYTNSDNLIKTKEALSKNTKSGIFKMECSECEAKGGCDWYYQAVPNEDTVYYILISVDSTYVTKDLAVDKMKIPMFIIGIITIISIEDSIYLRMKKED